MATCPECGRRPGVFDLWQARTFSCSGCGARLRPRRASLVGGAGLLTALFLGQLAADAVRRAVGHQGGLAVALLALVGVSLATMVGLAAVFRFVGAVDVHDEPPGAGAVRPADPSAGRAVVALVLVLALLAAYLVYALGTS